MKISNLFTLLLMILIFQTGCESIPSAKNELEIQTFTADLAGFSVNSHLIMWTEKALLVDAQFTRSQADKVVDLIKNSGRELSQVYITHAHPDHYLGLEKIIKAFPAVEIIARAEVVKGIKETAQGKIDYWKTMYKDELADKFLLPTSFSGNEIFLEGQRIEIVDFGKGESSHDTALYIPSSRELLTGDMTYGKVHFWLAEQRADHVLENLNKLAAFDVTMVYPGHGEVGGSEVIATNIKYLEDFIAVTNSGLSVEKAKEKMLAKYSTYKLPIILDLSLKAVIK